MKSENQSPKGKKVEVMWAAVATVCAGKAVSRRYRNRRIGEFLKELELTEGRSTGIPKMLRTMAENGSNAPSFETDDERSAYMVRLPTRINLTDPVSDPVSDPVTGGVTQLVTQLDENVKRLLQLVGEGEVSPKILRQNMGISHRTFFRNTYLNPALDAGWIEATLPDKPTSRNQKYRLTEGGRQILKGIPSC